MTRARRIAMARLCLVCLALLLLAQDVHSRKFSGALAQDQEQRHGHATASPEPRSEEGSSGGAKRGQPQSEPTKWEEIHTDYIYTQDVKYP
uniref:Uncharacterized protein n=1 Tax=Avena sativa TaxID=4498 RepID=A0ACD5UH26_AVESA